MMSANPCSIDLDARRGEGRSQQELVGIARRYRPLVVGGSIPAADLQVSCSTMKMDQKHLDWEFAARIDRSRAQAETAKAVLRPCPRREDALRLRRVAREREITATVLSL